jgi:prepilin-type N-terminal cleavage/methylation domain-containing protein
MMHLIIPSQTRSRSGFSLIEILVVILVIGLLMALLVPALGMLRNKAKVQEARNLCQRVVVGIQSYRLEKGLLLAPDGGSFLDFRDDGTGVVDTLMDRQLLNVGLDGQSRPVTGGKRLHDPWGQPYRYVLQAGADDQGHQPQALITSEAGFADWEHAESGTYVYSYGRRNPDGNDVDRWIFPTKGGQ